MAVRANITLGNSSTSALETIRGIAGQNASEDRGEQREVRIGRHGGVVVEERSYLATRETGSKTASV